LSSFRIRVEPIPGGIEFEQRATVLSFAMPAGKVGVGAAFVRVGVESDLGLSCLV
jgi:hypothetical protein